MALKSIYQQLLSDKLEGKKRFSVLIDPDHLRMKDFELILKNAIDASIDYFFIGGSLIVNDRLDQVLNEIRSQCDIPMILFPGNSFQLSYHADALLFLSLISGRNPELLIGKHVVTAPFLKVSPLEIISTGYMLIDGGSKTTVEYMSNTTPIPHHKTDIAVCTAMAGELLGLKMIYMDAGSGAKTPISTDMIRGVGNAIDVPLIVGGGITTPKKAAENVAAGADLIVVGNAIEENPSIITEMSQAIHSAGK